MGSENGVITLITDFGLDDEYVGVMKGVILSINRQATVIDVTHQIPRHDVVHAALVLESSFSYFPQGSVHMVVVDPGVGTDRRVVCLESEGHRFLAPDNGVLGLVLRADRMTCLHAVVADEYFRLPVSHTFHGRDVFAPIAAHLSLGMEVGRLGKALTPKGLAALDFPQPRPAADGGLRGQVVAVDHFGNLITNIDDRALAGMQDGSGGDTVRIQVAGTWIEGLSSAYEAVPAGSPVAVMGSKNRLEICINQSDASARFGGLGTSVLVRLS